MSEVETKAKAPVVAAERDDDAPDGTAARAVRNLDAIMRIPVTVQVVLGSAIMPVATLMKMERGTVIPLDRRVGEPVEIIVNGRVIARGEVVVADEETSRFGVSLTELVEPAPAGAKD